MTARMQRLLIQVLTEPQKGGESLLGSIKIAVMPIAKVFTMCFLGFLMASKYVNILPANGRKLLNGLVFSLLLPCLIFSQLGQAITFQKMTEWWFIPFNVVLATISGSIIGLVVASIVRPPYPYFRCAPRAPCLVPWVSCDGSPNFLGNIGNVPLVLIAALCRDKSNPFGDFSKCSQDGNAYISFGQWLCWQLLEIAQSFGAIILYTYVFHMLAPPPGGTFDVENGNLPVKNPSGNIDNALDKDNSPEQIPLLAAGEDIPAHSSALKKDNVKDFLKYLYEKLKLKQIIQPPIVASILAIFIGCVPYLKKLVFTSDAPLYFFTDSCMILGEAMIPCILLALGGNLVDGPGQGSSRIGARTTAAIIFGRLVLVPPTGLGIVMLADKLGFLPQALLPIYEDVGRRQHRFCSGFIFVLFSPWLDGLFFI
ncbi:Protein PIN-LIKES 6 [Orobanche gracilis]